MTIHNFQITVSTDVAEPASIPVELATLQSGECILHHDDEDLAVLFSKHVISTF